MTDVSSSPKTESIRRTSRRQYRKKNHTTTIVPVTYVPETTTIITTNNSTEFVNASSVPVNDFFAPISFLTQNKYIFFIGLSLLTFLCVISIVFLIIISKCIKGNGRKRTQLLNKDKRFRDIRDFLDDTQNNPIESQILLDKIDHPISLINTGANANGFLTNDNISNTLSIDPLFEQKIINNNLPNVSSLSPAADDTSIDTLRGSLISSPSQNVSVNQISTTPTRLTTTDSCPIPDDRAVEAEKDDDLHDLDLKPVQSRYTKATNSSSNLSAHRSSIGSVAEQSIRKQDQRNEVNERKLLHGSNSNLYEKEMRKRAEDQKAGRKEHTNSLVSLTSRTSEDSCY